MTGRVRRHFLTGELEEVPFESDNGKIVYVYGDEDAAKEQRRVGPAISELHPWTSRALGVVPEDFAKRTRELKQAGIYGEAYYDRRNHGRLVCTSRKARNKVLALRNMGDADAGYGDRPPGG